MSSQQRTKPIRDTFRVAGQAVLRRRICGLTLDGFGGRWLALLPACKALSTCCVGWPNSTDVDSRGGNDFWRYRRPAWVQDQPLVVQIDVGGRIHRTCNLQRLDEPLAELADTLVRRAELSMEGAPRHHTWGCQDVEAVGEPAVDVDGLTVVAQRPDRRVFQWNRMALQVLKEAF